jgi:hypothetical protein
MRGKEHELSAASIHDLYTKDGSDEAAGREPDPHRPRR